MPPSVHDHAVEELDDPSCRALVRTARLGRVSYTRDALPAIQPVTFCVHGDQVVIPARPHSPLVSGTRGAVVAFQVDSIDADTCTGWTVTVVGPSRSVTDPAEVTVLDALHWPVSYRRPDACYISIAMALLTGWRDGPLPRAPIVPPRDDGPRRLAAPNG
ncbi:pyridoxamine 5'-phosphate oxidase family protein [Geodermatophilus sp. CPCC 206100]|uniref:pyridoxamine 5'-phosphate oxidase family protein n=1 Tax=Geodermatophilus sp. CPCC 206100 TaxID=3020054 RepID=UPI003B008D44